MEDGLHREDELGNRVWRHQVSDSHPPSNQTTMEISKHLHLHQPHLCQQVQEEPREIVEQVVFLAFLVLPNQQLILFISGASGRRAFFYSLSLFVDRLLSARNSMADPNQTKPR